MTEGKPTTGNGRIEIRGLLPGDLGWVIGRHGAVYAQEFGWNQEFEALVATIAADYASNIKQGRENAWIATVDGVPSGCVFCCEKDSATAQLRLLLVETSARGLDLGRLLVDTCMQFAREVGYDRMMLWTNDILVAARRIYEDIGFTLVEEEAHHSFGVDLVGQIWEIELRSPPETR